MSITRTQLDLRRRLRCHINSCNGLEDERSQVKVTKSCDQKLLWQLSKAAQRSNCYQQNL